MTEVAREKSALRREMRAALANLPQARRVASGRAIVGHLTGGRAWAEASGVALFAALPDEVDTGPLIERARADGKEVLLPRMQAEAELEFVRVGEDARLVAGRFGVLEPAAEYPAVRLTPAVLVFVPGLAFDRQGGRLGRGAGYYDRALARELGGKGGFRRIGIGFGLQMVNRVPMSSFDVRMDAIVTDEEIVFVE